MDIPTLHISFVSFINFYPVLGIDIQVSGIKDKFLLKLLWCLFLPAYFTALIYQKVSGIVIQHYSVSLTRSSRVTNYIHCDPDFTHSVVRPAHHVTNFTKLIPRVVRSS